MKFWGATAFMSTAEVLRLAQVADRVGLHGIMVSDHVFTPTVRRSKYPYTPNGDAFWAPDAPWPDPWVLIGAMAAVTRTLRFATNIYVAPARDLFTVAKLVSTAAVVSDERVALGVGAGWCEEEFEQLGQEFATRGKRLDEMIAALRLLWGGGPVEHHGQHYDFDELRIEPVPNEPIPIYVGGDSPAALRRAARHGDGWIGNAYSPEEAEAKVAEMHAALDAAGRTADGFEVILALMAMPDRDLHQQMEHVGVTGLLCAPWMFANTPEDRTTAIEAFADEFVRHEVGGKHPPSAAQTGPES